MNIEDIIRTTYTLLPPPLSALPAKYHAPVSIAIHSLSSGYTAYRLAELAELEEYSEIAFLLGLTHDIHQKLVEDGLSTLKKTKEYIRGKLDELGYSEYTRYIEDALEADMCGKENPVRGLPIELATICYIGDMVQGRIEGLSLLLWLREKIEKISDELTVRYYNIAIPQPFARAYAMIRIYKEYIESSDHLALASPWGLYVISYSDELPEVIEASWDDLRIDPIIDYGEIIDIEEKKKSTTIYGISISGDEAKNKLWSRFARLFYKREKLVDKQGRQHDPLYPILPPSLKGLFINIAFTDVEFREIKPEEAYQCGLCGTIHHRDHSLPITMYGTKKSPKIAGVRITPEKWNRFLPAHLKVKTWDSRGPWRHGIGMCPLCTLDAVSIRMLGFAGRIDGFIILSLAKPVPVELLKILGQTLRSRRDIEDAPVATGKLDSLILDYTTATIATSRDVREPVTENMFKRGERVPGELYSIGKLLSLGLYPLKYLPGLDNSIVDRLLVSTITFQILDFPATSGRYSNKIPWITKLVEEAGSSERSRALKYLMSKPSLAPLHLLSLNKPVYDHVNKLLVEVGVRA